MMNANDSNSGTRGVKDPAAARIEQLAGRNPEQPEFFSEFLKIARERFGAYAIAIWSWSGGQLRLQSETEFQATEFSRKPDLVEWLRRQLILTLQGDCGRAVSSTDIVTVLGVPQFDILMAPLCAGSRKVGVVQIFLKYDGTAPSLEEGVGLLESMAGVASAYLERRLGPQASEPRLQSGVFFEFLLKLQQCDRLRTLGSVVVNDGCTLLRADRITLLRKWQQTTTIVSATGREQVSRLSPQVRYLKQLASAVVATGRTLRWGGRDEAFPEGMERAVMDYVELSQARLLLVVPLQQSQQSQETSDGSKRAVPETIGCLMIERFHDDEPTPEMAHWVDQFVKHVAAAMSLALTHESILFLPIWRGLGAARRWLVGRRLLMSLTATGAAAGGAALLLFGEWEYRVEGTGRLMPVMRSEVFAPEDSEVVAIHVGDGDLVKPGQMLVQLHSDELDTRYVAAANELLEKQQQVLSYRAELDHAKEHARRDEAIRLQGEVVKTQIAVAAAEEHRAILEARRKQLEVRSPLAGIVSTFQVEQLLRDRPIRRGDLLLEVMNESGEWHLELEIPEHRMGHVLSGRKGYEDGRLPIDFLLVTAPEAEYTGSLQEVATRSVNSADGDNVVEVFATFEKKTVPDLRIGAEVRAHVHCGKRSIGYVLLGDIIEFIQMTLWY